jgi:hypothetical protein
MSQRPVDSHRPPDQVFCSADSELRSFFVEVTLATPNPLAAAGWLVRNLERFVPDGSQVELDVNRLRCVGWGPGFGARELWHFDVSEALTVGSPGRP